VHVAALAHSTGELGLIEPIVVDVRQRLLAGGHRLEALRRMRVEEPEVYARWFSAGVPVYVRDFDAELDPKRALEVEIAENERRSDYTPAQIKDLVVRLKDVGYRDTVGRPRSGEKALGPALEVIVGKSMKTIRKLIADGGAEGGGEGGSPKSQVVPVQPLEVLVRAMAKHQEAVPPSLLPRFAELLEDFRAELAAVEE
jgi:ParB family chromosome partitioning protein